jgi:alpha-galactosidase
MKPTKIVVIGAGSASFGLNTLSALMNSPRLAGSQIALVDRDSQSLDRMYQLAGRLNHEWGAQMSLSSHPTLQPALDGADFVVSAIEVSPRYGLWRTDYEIPLRHGVRQPYAENGGPGGFAHAARNIGPVLEIAHEMERLCPQAWFINFSNPMMRICDAINRYSRIKVIGLCHQIFHGYYMVGYLLADYLGIDVPQFDFENETISRPAYRAQDHIVNQVKSRLDIQAAGLNHFTWMLSVHDKHTGEDLYPRVLERWLDSAIRIEPLTQRMVRAFGMMPIPGDGHLCEYLPWLADSQTQPWKKYHIPLKDWDGSEEYRQAEHRSIALMVAGEKPVDELRSVDSEGALEVIENIAKAGNHYHLAVNLPNRGYIPNLP